MKRLSYVAITIATISAADASYDAKRLKNEISSGLDILTAEIVYDKIEEPAPGELGKEVYQIAGAVQSDDVKMFIPTSMYVRMGAGLNLGFATDKAQFNNEEFESSGSWTTQIGLGWNLSSYVRTEIDFQNSTFKFSDLEEMQATYNTIGGMLYFDFARRYVQNGDITKRRTFVPFMGIGAGLGAYEFQGIDGADGAVIAAPRATLGFNVSINDLIGIDIAYQYQMMIGNGFGWGANNGGVDNISNIMASIRANF